VHILFQQHDEWFPRRLSLVARCAQRDVTGKSSLSPNPFDPSALFFIRGLTLIAAPGGLKP
jgi:hypothetical protein